MKLFENNNVEMSLTTSVVNSLPQSLKKFFFNKIFLHTKLRTRNFLAQKRSTYTKTSYFIFLQTKNFLNMVSIRALATLL